MSSNSAETWRLQPQQMSELVLSEEDHRCGNRADHKCVYIVPGRVRRNPRPCFAAAALDVTATCSCSSPRSAAVCADRADVSLDVSLGERATLRMVRLSGSFNPHFRCNPHHDIASMCNMAKTACVNTRRSALLTSSLIPIPQQPRLRA